MGLFIRLEDENGYEVGFIPETRLLNSLIPNLDDDRFELLGYVDPYGDTIFSWTQAESLIRDLQRAKEKAASEEALALIDQIILLASRAAQQGDLYLKFCGD
jgi:hypothetical protein